MPTVYNKVTAGGSTLIDLSQDTVTSASDIVSGKVGHLADGTQVTGTGGGGNDYIVTLSKNSQTGYWEPNKTYAEISAANTAGKTIACCAYDEYDTPLETQCFFDSGAFHYEVGEWDAQGGAIYYLTWYDMDANGITPETPTPFTPPATFGTKTITVNGTYNAWNDDYVDGYSEVIVNVPSSSPTLQSKTATPSESQQTISPDSGYDGLSSVTVGAVSSTYVGSGVARKSSSDLTASGLTVTAPVGYYASDATKTLSDANLIAANIKKDVSIFGVTGTYEGSGGGGGAQHKIGTYTPSSTYSSTGNREITTLSNIGFTPKKFVFYVTNRANLTGKSAVLLYAMCDTEHTARFTMRYSNTSGTTSVSGDTTNWIMQSNGYLYCDGTTVYFRTTSSYKLVANVEYTWEAFG